MIEFDCPHCDNRFTVPDELSGRDGWCRVCKRLIIVPRSDGSGLTWDELPLAEKCRRLDRMLRYAAEKADRLKRRLSKHYAEDGEPISAKIGAHYSKSKKAFKQHMVAANDEINQLAEELATSIRARDQAEKERSRLSLQMEQLTAEIEMEHGVRAQLEAKARSRDALERDAGRADTFDMAGLAAQRAALDKAEARILKLSQELEGATQDLDDSEARREVLNQVLQSVRNDLETATVARDASQAERLRLDHELGYGGNEFEVRAGIQDGGESHDAQGDSEAATLALENVEAERRRLDEEAGTLRASLDIATQARDEAEDKRQGLEQELEVLRSGLDTAGQARDEAEAKRKGLEEELEALRASLDTGGQARDEAEAERQKLEEEIGGLRQALDDTTQERETRNAEVDRLESEVKEFGVRFESAEKEASHLGNENARLREELNVAQAVLPEMDELRQKVRELDEKGHELDRERASFEEKLRLAEAEVDRLRRKKAAREDGQPAAKPGVDDGSVYVSPRNDWPEIPGAMEGEEEDRATAGEVEFEPVSGTGASASATVVFDDDAPKDPIVESYLNFLDSE